MVSHRIDRLLAFVAIFLGAGVFATTVYGVHYYYSPIIFMDEWDGYLGFYRQVLQGAGFSAWWENHADHRIITSRVLFWLDLQYFQGNHIIMFVANLVMLAAIVFIIGRRGPKDSRLLAYGLGAALMFSWAQKETLTWGFETQIPAAFLFAVWSFSEFCKTDEPLVWRFGWAYLLALLSELSMGNGLGTPFVLIAAAIILRRPIREFVSTIVLASVMIGVYFIHYNFWGDGWARPMPQQESYFVMITKFFMLTLGNPLSQIGAPAGLCMTVGLVTVVTTAGLAGWLWGAKQITPYRGFLFCVLLFALSSVGMIVAGRSIGGYSHAILSRYTTAPLLTWFSLAMLARDSLGFARRNVIVGAIIVLAAVTAFVQRDVCGDTSYLYARKLGILSNRIGMDREGYTTQLFPQASPWRERFVANTAFAADHHLGIYNEQWLREAGVVQFDAGKVTTNDNGHVEHITRDPDGVWIVSGWLATQDPNTLIVLVDGNKTVGYGVTGRQRPDVAAKFGLGFYGGWEGFARSDSPQIAAYSYSNGQFCRLK